MRKAPRERTATPEEFEDDARRCREAREHHRPLAPTTYVNTHTDIGRANIRAMRKDLKRTASMVAMPSMTDLVFGDASSGSAPFANDNGVTS